MLLALRRSIPWIGVLTNPHTMALGVPVPSVASAASKGQQAAVSLLNTKRHAVPNHRHRVDDEEDRRSGHRQPDRYLGLGA